MLLGPLCPFLDIGSIQQSLILLGKLLSGPGVSFHSERV